MTGFGQASGYRNGIRVSVEIRSFNHRFFELTTHLPDGYAELDLKLKPFISQQLRRGKIIYSLRLETEEAKVHLNKKLAKIYLKDIQKLSQELSLDNQVGISEIIHLPGILNIHERKVASFRLWPLVREVSLKALNQVVASRRQEGQLIYSDLKGQVGQIVEQLRFIKDRMPKVIRDKQQTLPEGEMVPYLTSTDIHEELSRLGFHIRRFSQALRMIKTEAKPLDFMAQEMQREVNTLGAKSQDAMISQAVVVIKTSIEKMREQLQNAE
jgi:uncharacterized protein (TIGR00255 family)